MNVLTSFKVPRVRSRAHMSFVGTLPCCACGRKGSTQVHHSLIGPEGKARGLKASDRYVLPVCFVDHNAIHALGDEASFWQSRGIDSLAIAEKLWAASVAAGRT